MNRYYALWDVADQDKIRNWWETLQKNPGWRAELKRTEKPEVVFLTKGFRVLYFEFRGSKWVKDEYLLGLAAMAGILAYIKKDDDCSFAVSCARESDNSKKPVVSERRFSQLQKSRSLDELFTRMRRLIKLLGEKTSITSVADCVLHWFQEMVLGEAETEARNRILVRWGLEYFQSLPKEA